MKPGKRNQFNPCAIRGRNPAAEGQGKIFRRIERQFSGPDNSAPNSGGSMNNLSFLSYGRAARLPALSREVR